MSLTCRRPSSVLFLAVTWATLLNAPTIVMAQKLSADKVLKSIDRGQQFLLSRQRDDGSWQVGGAAKFQVGATSLVLLSLINSGMTAKDPEIQKGLQYLRGVKEPQPDFVYEMSLMISALVAARDGERDKPRIAQLAGHLERMQITIGDNKGSWGYTRTRQTSGDRSNAQFAILGLRDAANAGFKVNRTTWSRARDHWLSAQNTDGGWGYSNLGDKSSGSMTAAGIASLVITSRMLQDASDDLTPEGRPNCCRSSSDDPYRKALDRGVKWMARNFAVGHNPGNNSWILYYLYGLERAGRLSGLRFFGNHDWYRAGARFLVAGQSPRDHSWRGQGHIEADPVVGTSFALLFLSKGLSPVLMNKMEFGESNDWEQHPYDVTNLTDHITTLPKWPHLLSSQVVDVKKLDRKTGSSTLTQAPMLLITGSEKFEFSKETIEIFKEYINQGGFIFAVRNCEGEGFDASFRRLIETMYPEEAELALLPDDHPVFRSEYPFPQPELIDFWGVEFGCRTAIIYSREDLSCLWGKWARFAPQGRAPQTTGMISRAMKLGVNVVAYATGREPPNKLENDETKPDEAVPDPIERGLLQIAKLRQDEGRDVAPKALRNLLMNLNQTAGIAVSTAERQVKPVDASLFRYPLVYMHGRNAFQMTPEEQEQLQLYLKRGGVLFANACCGSKAFDRSFRNTVGKLFPGVRLERIPVTHELFSQKIGHDIRKVRRRSRDATPNPNQPLTNFIREGEPLLEGLSIDGRLAVIYSPYDISCALQKQSTIACPGYLSEDAFRIAINVVLYAMLQDADYREKIQ